VNIHNHSPFVPDVRFVQDEHGYECATLMLKASFAFPRHDLALAPAMEQSEWFEQDQQVTTTLRTYTTQEADLPIPKRHVEYLVSGSIFSGDGVAAERLAALVSIGGKEKKLSACAAREWQVGAYSASASKTTKILSVPIGAEFAFGGADPTSDNGWYEPNPMGIGYCESPHGAKADGLQLPQLEAFDRSCNSPCKEYPFVTLGPIARNSLSRRNWSGKYDQEWLETRWPRLPLNFDERFFQTTQSDQWLPELVGGEEVVLAGLTPANSAWGSVVRFKLPKFQFNAMIHWRDKVASTQVLLRPDTIVFEPEKGRFSVTSRYVVTLDEDVHEIEAISFGDTKQREQLAPFVPTFIDLEDFIAQVRGPAESAGKPGGHKFSTGSN
jgi:hypothetical protein